MKTIFDLTLTAMCALLPFVVGCGGSSLPSGETGTVQGRVTYNGQAVPAGSTLLFIRTEGGITGTATTGSNGEYSLSMRDGSQVLTGTYRVAVTPPPDPSATLSDEELMERSMAGTLPDVTEVKEVPERYRSPESSPLVAEVKAGANTIDLEMTE